MRLARTMAAIWLLAAVAVGGCGAEQIILDPPPPSVEARESDFRLTMSVPRDAFGPTDPIELVATLTWEGPEPRTTVWAPAGGPVDFVLRQIDGSLRMGGDFDLECQPHEFERGVPRTFAYHKHGSFAENDPNADFYRAFFVAGDPTLRLPIGHWRSRHGSSAASTSVASAVASTSPLRATSWSGDAILRRSHPNSDEVGQRRP